MTKENDILTSTESNTLTVKELAQKLKVHEKTILRRVKEGMPCLRGNTPKSVIRFEWDKVQAYLERGNK